MQLQTLQAKVRETGRKGLNTEARVNGEVPAVVYGLGEDAVSLKVNTKALQKILHTEGGMHSVLKLEFSDTPELDTPVLMKAVQRHPVRDTLLHVDFLRIRLDQRIQSQVAIVLVGRAKGVIDGGVIDHQIREVDVDCLALELPDHIEVDITHLEMGGSVHVGDLKVSEGVTILTDPELAIASIHAPRVLKTAEETAAEEAEAAEGEVEESE